MTNSIEEKDLDNLEITDIVSLTGKDIEALKEDLSSRELTINDLKSLKKAESAGKDRKKVKKVLAKEISHKEVSNYLKVAEEDIRELEEVLGTITSFKNINNLDHEEDLESLDQEQVINLLGGTVKELKSFIKSHKIRIKDLEELLEAEKKVKNRKTATRFLEKRINKRKVEDDVSKAEKDLEKLKTDIEKLEEDTANSDLEKEENKSEAEENNAEEDVDKAKDTEEDSEENNESSEIGKEEGKPKDKDEKKEILEDLDIDMSEEELMKLSLDDLKSIKEEKEYREDLINQLIDAGLPEEELRNSSTRDLEKLANGLSQKDLQKEEQEETNNKQEFNPEDDDPKDKTDEEIREEAQEDLEMLMGASKSKNKKTESDKSPKEKLSEIKENIKSKFERSSDEEEEETEAIREDRVKEVLESYRELDNKEAAIKTAQVMKGYLEYSLDINRELTYKELADTLPEDKDHMNELSDFYRKMHREQYIKKVNIDDIDHIIDICEQALEKM